MAASPHAGHTHTAKLSVRERAAIDERKAAYADQLRQVHAEIIDLLENRPVDLSTQSVAEAEVSEAFGAARPQLDQQFQQMLEAGVRAGWERALTLYALSVGVSVGVALRDLSSRLNDVSRQSSQIVHTRMAREISVSITTALDNGYTREEVADRLQDGRFEVMRNSEARRIANTEVPRGASLGAQKAYQEDPDVTYKRWTTVGDHRVRPSHVVAGGTEVPLGEPFSVGGHDAQFPRDPHLPPSQAVFCRCWLVPVKR